MPGAVLPRVTVVTPSFNQARYLEETIRSVLEQDYSNLEYILVDGGSSDGSVESFKHIPTACLVGFGEGPRATDAINKGFARASRILAWLNSDDIFQPGALPRRSRRSAASGSRLIYGQANYIDGTGRVIGRFPSARTDYRRLRRGYVHIPQQSAFFRADLWRKVGPLDPTFFFAMDYDLWVRLAAEAPLVHVERVWASFRLHADAKTIFADDRCWPEMLRVHYRDGGSPFAWIVLKYWIRKLVSPYINWRRRRLFRL